MTDFTQFGDAIKLESQSDNQTATAQQSNANPPSEFSASKSTSAATGVLQPLRPRVMPTPIASVSSIPKFPVVSNTMNMESLSLLSPSGPNRYQISGGFLGSAHEDRKRGRKARRKRTSPVQLAELLKVFETNDNPNHDVREMLSKKVGMTNREVQVWFQNRRAKEANMEKKHDQPDSSPTDVRDQPIEGRIRHTAKKIQPIQAAPYPPRSYSYSSSGTDQFSAFRRMSLAITPDGRTVFFPQPTFAVPNLSPANAQQFAQQTQPVQFMPQTATNFLPATGAPMQAFPGAPQMMLVPVFASPQGFLPASASGYAYAPAPPTYSDPATGAAASDVTGISRRESFIDSPESATDVQAVDTRITTKVEPEVPKTGADALNALASAASEQSLADSF